MKLIRQDKEGTYQLTDYLNHLDMIRDRLPHGARDFAFYQGHYDITHPRCLHDSWVARMMLTEDESRTIQIELLLFGAFHDGHHRIVYKDVNSYKLAIDKTRYKSTAVGHADWVVDELLLTDGGLVSHEIEFSDSARWHIVAKDIAYSWVEKGQTI